MGRAGRPKYDTKGEGIIITGYNLLLFKDIKSWNTIYHC